MTYWCLKFDHQVDCSNDANSHQNTWTLIFHNYFSVFCTNSKAPVRKYFQRNKTENMQLKMFDLVQTGSGYLDGMFNGIAQSHHVEPNCKPTGAYMNRSRVSLLITFSLYGYGGTTTVESSLCSNLLVVLQKPKSYKTI